MNNTEKEITITWEDVIELGHSKNAVLDFSNGRINGGNFVDCIFKRSIFTHTIFEDCNFKKNKV